MGGSPHAQLGGWKAIAAYLQRDERTVMRWAAQRGMPVQRVPGQGRASVYASPEALDAWLRSGAAVGARDDAPPADPAPADTAHAAVARTVMPAPRGGGPWIVLAACAILLSILFWRASSPRPETTRTEALVFTDPTAKALYLKATYDWNMRTEDSLLRATREYSEAIGRDPRVAASFVGLANCYLLLREYGSLPDDEAYPRAEAAATAALALAPSTAAIHRVLAFLAFWWHGDRATARHEFARALALAPDDPLTHHWFANALSANGEHQAALREIDLARDLDPTSSSVLGDAGLLTYLAGHRPQGVAMLETQARDQPQAVSPHRALADVALFEGRGAKYLAETRAVERLRGDLAGERVTGRLATVPEGHGAVPLLHQMLAEARLSADRSSGGYYRLARIASLAEKRPDADAALGRACRAREATAIGANGDLWLSHSLSPERIRQLCGYTSLL